MSEGFVGSASSLVDTLQAQTVGIELSVVWLDNDIHKISIDTRRSLHIFFNMTQSVRAVKEGYTVILVDRFAF
jgi:hypothetical protein